MAARKVLYLLRRPFKDGYADHLLPVEASASAQDEFSLVLLEEANGIGVSFPGRTYVLSESQAEKDRDSHIPRISYDDLLKLIWEADSTVVL